MYNYSDNFGSTITVTRLSKELYQIILIQETQEPIFDKLDTRFTLVNKESHIDFIDLSDNAVMHKQTTTIKVKANCNPPPEDLFKITPGN